MIKFITIDITRPITMIVETKKPSLSAGAYRIMKEIRKHILHRNATREKKRSLDILIVTCLPDRYGYLFVGSSVIEKPFRFKVHKAFKKANVIYLAGNFIWLIGSKEIIS